MTTIIAPNPKDVDVVRIDVVGVITGYRRFILGTTISVTVMVALLAGWYWLFGPTRTIATQQFRPVFSGATNGEYPNGLKFGLTDIIESSVLDEVFDKNAVKDYCDRDAFRSGFSVEQRSTAYRLLDSEYEAKLADTRITPIERTRLQTEYQTRRSALPLTYLLTFIRPEVCKGIPNAVMTKALNDVLAVWATNAESKRSVLKLNVQVLTPNSLDIMNSDQIPQLIRTDLIRGALRRLSANVHDVEQLPGASIIRLGEKRQTFSEIRMRVINLLEARLEPLFIGVGRGPSGGSLAWAEQALASATRDQKVAEGSAAAYLDALREYSGTAQTSSAPDSRQSQAGSSEAPALTPQIDRTFVDRIVELSAPNLAFRQELTRSLVSQNVEAVRQQANVNHYQNLVNKLREPGTGRFTVEEIEARLKSVQDDGKTLAKEFNELYDEFSRLSLRASPFLFQLDGPVHVEVTRALSTRAFLFAVAGAFFLALLVSFGGGLIWSRLNS